MKYSADAKIARTLGGVSLAVSLSIGAITALGPVSSWAATNVPPSDTQVRPLRPPSTTIQPVNAPDITVGFKNLSCSYNANLQKYVVNFKAKIQNFSGNPTWNTFKTKVSSPMGNLQAAFAAQPGNPKVSPAPMQGWTEWGFAVGVNTPGKYTLILHTDFEGTQPETNENNNKAKHTIACQ